MDRCARCRTAEPIEKERLLKFDLAERPLCRRCWEEFRRFLRAGARLREAPFGESVSPASPARSDHRSPAPEVAGAQR